MPKKVKQPAEYITVDDFVNKYGEAIKQTDAAKLLGLKPQAINNMCGDGRLQRTPCKTVLVRSIHAFLFGTCAEGKLRMAK